MAESADDKQLRADIREGTQVQETEARRLQDLIKTDQKGSAKERQRLNDTLKNLDKTQNSIGGDLRKNMTDLGNTFQTTADGMINEAFGPMGAVVSTFTTGFLKRSKEAKENEEKRAALAEQAEAQAQGSPAPERPHLLCRARGPGQVQEHHDQGTSLQEALI